MDGVKLIVLCPMDILFLIVSGLFQTQSHFSVRCLMNENKVYFTRIGAIHAKVFSVSFIPFLYCSPSPLARNDARRIEDNVPSIAG